MCARGGCQDEEWYFILFVDEICATFMTNTKRDEFRGRSKDGDFESLAREFTERAFILVKYEEFCTKNKKLCCLLQCHYLTC